MGLIMLALFSLNLESTEGAVFQMINHGLSTGALFLCVGVLYERSHTRLIKDYGGVSRQMPVFSAVFLMAMLSSMGLPGLNGFIGEILCFFGIFAGHKVLAVLAVSTAILSAAYLLWLFRRVMHGPILNEKILGFKDMGGRERVCFIPIIVLMFWLGLFPGSLLRKMDASVAQYLKTVKVKSAVLEGTSSQKMIVSPSSGPLESAKAPDGGRE
jgi:NADH-quinone oxidoreductase subunit M